MRRQVKYWQSIFFIVIIVSGCDDFISEDLEDQIVKLSSPSDSLITIYSTQTFTWEEVDGADEYNLQIVSESFNNLHFYEVDTNLSGGKFVYNLDPGKYQWRVKAFNSTSSTPYFTRTLQMDSTDDLNKQSVILNFPISGYKTNDTLIDFSWSRLYNADFYIFELRQNNFTGPFLYKDTVVEPNISNILSEGKYAWGVKAVNSTSSTSFSSFVLSIDLTAPSEPSILTIDTIQENPFTIRWQRSSADVTVDSLYMYTSNSLNTNILKIEANQEYTDSLPTGVYYWRVKSIDEAGNTGNFSGVQKIRITP